jgi:aminoglycoside phosphotransferase (APT) family kinase protein
LLIPDRKIAIDKMREVIGEIRMDAEGNDKLNAQTMWLNATLDQLALLEDKASYAQLYQRGYQLAEEGLRRRSVKDAAEMLSVLPNEHHADAGTDVYRSSFAGLLQCMVHIVKALAGDKSAATVQYLNRMTDWENALYQRLEPRQVAHKAAAQVEAEAGFTPEGLQAYLRQKLPHYKNLVVVSMQTLYGGFSKQTIMFSIRDDNSCEQSMVIRAENKARLVFLDGANIDKEFACVSYLYQLGKLPIAEPLWVETDTRIFGTRFMVSRRAPGNIFGTSLSKLSSMPKVVQSSFMTTLANIHRHPIDVSDPLVAASHLPQWTGFASIQDNIRAWVTYFMGELARSGCSTTPMMERTCTWLLDNIPREDIKPVLIHGDYGLANLLIDDGRVSAVLDWELSHMGDPGCDMINFMFEYDRSLIDIYEQAGGQRISEYRFIYYSIFRIIKGITILIGLHQLETDRDATLNYYLLPGAMRTLSAPLNDLLEKAGTMENAG